MLGPNVTGLGQGLDPISGDPLFYLTVTQDITDKIKAEQRHERLTRDITATDDYDAHRHTLIAKLAAIAVLADGRNMIEMSDWQWAEGMYAHSASVRDTLLELADDSARTEQAKRGQEMARTDRARRGFDGDEVRVAHVVLNKLVAQGGQATRREVDRAVASRDRGLLAGALDQLVSAGRIKRTEDGRGYALLTS